MNDKPIRILFVDDSNVIIQILYSIFEDDPCFEIIGVARNGLEAIEKTNELKPDVITMDIEMDTMNGIEATRKIMSETPTPIVVLSSHTNQNEANNAFEAINYGALTVIQKPANILDKGFDVEKRKLVKLVKAMSEIKVIRRRVAFTSQQKPVLRKRIHTIPSNIKILALGASTGGPEAITSILQNMGTQLKIPIVIVLHISEGFLPGYIKWLQKEVPFPIHIANQFEKLEPGHIYFAPDNKHLLVKNKDTHAEAFLSIKDRTHTFIPSITVLFESLAKSFPKQVVAGLLTGMGRDGANGLLSLKQEECLTFIQSEKSSIIYGMPGQAKKMDAAQMEIDLEDIGPFFARINRNMEDKS